MISSAVKIFEEFGGATSRSLNTGPSSSTESLQLYCIPSLEQTVEQLLRNLPTYSVRTLARNRRSILTLELLQSSCDLNCRCKCHGSLQRDSHWLWTGLVGCLLKGYTAKPISSLVCNIKDCQSQSSKITFAFPTWFWYRALSVSTGLCYQPGPERCLTVRSVRPSKAEVDKNGWRIKYAPICYNDRKVPLCLLNKRRSAGAISTNGDTLTRALNDQNLSRNAGRAGTESSRAVHDSQSNTLIHVDPPWRQPEHDERASEPHIKPHQAPIFVQKDTLLKYFNTLPSIIQYVNEVTPPDEDAGACISKSIRIP